MSVHIFMFYAKLRLINTSAQGRKMAGSIKTFIYTDDAGIQWMVNLDESNGELAGFGFTDFTAANPNITPLAKGYEMRYIRVGYQFGDPIESTTRKIYIGAPGAVAAVLALASVLLPLFFGAGGFGAFVPLSFTAEKRKVYSPADSGLNDGDVT